MTTRQFNRIHGFSGLAISLVTAVLCVANLLEIALPRIAIIFAIVITAIATPIVVWSIVKLIKKERKQGDVD